MDKQLLKAYVRTIVEDEIRRVLPEVLAEAIGEIKQLKETAVPGNISPVPQKQKIDKNRMAELMGLTYDGNTLMATTNSMPVNRLPENAPTDVDPAVSKAINRNYSDLMKKMGIV